MLSAKWMTSVLQRYRLWIGIGILVVGCSYDPSVVYEYRFADDALHPADTFEIGDIPKDGIWWLEIRYLKTYPYQNVWIKIISSSGTDTLISIALFRPDGLPYGVRVGPYYRMRAMIPLRKWVRNGPFQMIPYMRPDRVEGMKSWRIRYRKEEV